MLHAPHWRNVSTYAWVAPRGVGIRGEDPMVWAAHTAEGHQDHNAPSLFYTFFLSLFSLFPDKISLAPFNGLSLIRVIERSRKG